MLPVQSQTGGDQRKGGASGFSEEKRKKLSEFSLSLVKTFLKSGYYSSDHPEAAQAINKLYTDFKELVTPEDELSYILISSIEKQDVLIEGMEDESLYFSGIMGAGMAELFTVKFFDYLSRHNLVSISLLGSLTHREWLEFLNAMNASLLHKDVASQHNFLNAEFESKRIRHVKIIFNEEVLGQKRNISWRAKLAIAKLNKDISQLPVLKGKTEAEIQEIKGQIYWDVLRPIKLPRLVAELLMNIDLLKKENDLTGGEDALIQTIRILDPSILMETGRLLIGYQKQLQTSKPANISQDEYERRLAFLPEVILRVVNRTLKEEFEDYNLQCSFLEELYRSEIVKREQLPPAMISMLEAREVAEEVINKSSEFYNRLLNPQRNDEYASDLKRFLNVFGELARRKETGLLRKFLYATLYHNNSSLDNPFARMNEFAFSRFKSKEAFNEIKNVFMIANKIERETLQNLFSFWEDDSLPLLFDILKESQDISVRKSALDIISSFGEIALDYLINELTKPGVEWFYARNLLELISEVGLTGEGGQVISFLRHEHPKVRKAAVTACCALCGEEGEEQYIAALSDKDEEVVLAAIKALRDINSSNANAIKKYIQFLDWKEDAEDAAPDKVQIEVCAALSDLGEEKLPGGMTAEDILLKVIESHEGGGIFGKLLKKGKQKPSSIIIAAINALAIVGSEKSYDKVDKFSSSKDEAIKKAVENYKAQFED